MSCFAVYHVNMLMFDQLTLHTGSGPKKGVEALFLASCCACSLLKYHSANHITITFREQVCRKNKNNVIMFWQNSHTIMGVMIFELNALKAAK